MRPIPQVAIAFIKAHEALRLTAYEDAAGIVTVGWGHVALGLKPGQTIPQSLAELYLAGDLEAAAKGVCARLAEPVLLDLTDNQYAALISFVFNEGPQPNATLWKAINARNHDAVPGELARWVYAKDPKTGQEVKLEGLVNRRAAETVLWSTAEPGSAPDAPSSASTRLGPTSPLPGKKQSLAGHVVACVSVIGGACAQYAGPVKDAADKLSAYSGSHIIAHVSEALLTVGGAMIVALSVTAGLALIAWEAWARLIKPHLAALTAADWRIAGLAERTVQPLFTEAEKDFQAMAESPVVSAKLIQLGAAIATLKTRVETAEKALTDSQADIAAAAARQGELDQANGHIADLTAQVADLQAQLAAEKADHADDVNAIAALADNAAPPA